MSPGEVLFSAVADCEAGDEPGREPSFCAEAEGLLREVGAEALRNAPEAERGFVSRFGCLRGLPGWCDLLETSTLCDRDGCG